MEFNGSKRNKNDKEENGKMNLNSVSSAQPIETHWPSLEADFKDGFILGTSTVQSTALLDDTISLESDFLHETELGMETNNLEDETQLVEDLDFNDMEVRTQLVEEDKKEVCINSNDETTDNTELLSDDDELSDDGITHHYIEGFDCKNKIEEVANLSAGLVEKQLDGVPNGLENGGLGPPCSFDQERKSSVVDSDASADDEFSSGSVRRTFAAVRTASLRASGLSAARAMAAKGNEIGPNSTLSKSQVGLKEATVIDKNMHDFKSVVRNTRARKLVYDNIPIEIEASLNKNSNMDSGGKVNSPSLLACDHVVAGLSYIGSQEPGEFSQANALGYVDKLLEINDAGFSQTAGPVGILKSAPVSSVSGPRSLAKKAAAYRDPMEEVGGIFDWLDSREDEGGGEFFMKKKQAFFDSRGGQSLTEPKKSCQRDEFLTSKVHQKIKNFSHSEPRLMLNGSTESDHLKAAERHTKQNLFKDLGEQSTGKASREQVETTNFYSVGLDTQVAAEAMEELLCGSPANHDIEILHPVKQNSLKGSTRSVTRSRTHSKSLADLKRVSLRKRARSDSDSDGTARQSKQLKLLGTKLSRGNPSSLRRSLQKSREKNFEGKRSAKQTESKEKQKHQGNNIMDESSVKQVCRTSSSPTSSGHLHVLGTPVARRTRQGLAMHQAERTGISCCDSRDTRNWSHPNVRRSRHYVPSQTYLNGSSMVQGSPKCVTTEDKVQSSTRQKRTKKDIRRGRVVDFDSVKRKMTSDQRAPSPLLTPEQLPSGSAYNTPLNEANAISPVCIGDDTGKQLCRKTITRSSLKRELIRLDAAETEPSPIFKDPRRRKDMGSVYILFSHHLGNNIIKQQKKIMARLGVSIASSTSDATHFVVDKFVRTRNMLEMMALGKPVVTPLWLESCGQASCFIDEKKYILRDSKKEKEIGFNMLTSLACACENPLLQGKRVLITPNIKPDREMIVGLVKAVDGQAVERVGRSAMKGDKILYDLMVISCEEDYAICSPLIEKGAKVYTSELILNGIVIQKLEYERHRLFLDHVKRSRASDMVKK